MKTLFLPLIASTILLLGAGCTNTQSGVLSYSDLAACGDFPTTTADGGPTQRYFVCREAESGDCYYKRSRFVDTGMADCASDDAPYGNDECYRTVYDLYGSDGQSLQSAITEVSKSDVCGQTTQDFFLSKTSALPYDGYTPDETERVCYYQDKMLFVGESYNDGCNSHTCQKDGTIISTEMACEIE